MSDINRTREKIAKLLRLGMDANASQGEIDNAMAMAAQLMARHQLTRDDIDMDAVDPMVKMKMGRHFAFFKGSKATAWEDWLAGFVSDYIGSVGRYHSTSMPLRRNGVQLLDEEGNARTGCAIAFYGPEDDAECARILFEELRDDIAMMAILKWGEFAKGDGAAYAEGFVCGLLRQHQAAKEKLCITDTETAALILKAESTALAIMDKAKVWLKDTHKITLRSRRGCKQSNGSGDARSEGYQDGQAYDTKRPEVRRKLGV
jgi:hypothetical protein